MDMHVHEAEPVKDNDLVCERPEAVTPPENKFEKLYHYEMQYDKSLRPPADPQNPTDDLLERSRENDAAFLMAVQRKLPDFCKDGELKPGGKATDYRSLKHWNFSSRSPGDPSSSFDPDADKNWEQIMRPRLNGGIFNVETAEENDFIVLIEYPNLEVFPICVRCIPGDSLQR